LVNKFLDPTFERSLNQKFREKRFKFFLSLVENIKSNKPVRVLDIGGTEIYWERMKYAGANNLQITLLNLERVTIKSNNFKSVKGDACDLSLFKDKEFDIVFSNSVIEHLYSRENQKRMADEVMRVGEYYFIQTPNFYFPIEPHWLFPFFHFLPFGTRVFLTRNFDLGHYKKAADKDEAVNRVNEVKLLTEKEMKKLFPDGKVYREMFLGLVKSITMYRFPENQTTTGSDPAKHT
jgi:ubiquinone/menaquinone biosynthesis C-methylase UbiE